MDANPFYVAKQSGLFSRVVEANIQIQPLIHQPTPEGVSDLCFHYSEKYNIDLSYVDLNGRILSGDNIAHFFSYLQTHASLLAVQEGRSKGLILGHGQHHVIPLLIHNRAGTLHMVSFDSNSGARIKGYFRIADLFPEARFYLNAGTRQADEGSCMTDALCILKEALQLPDLIALLEAKNIIHHEAFQQNPTSIFRVPKAPNFSLFRMPEQLLFTAQVSAYLEEAGADLSVALRGGRTLGEYREHFVIHVSLLKNGTPIASNVNSYLYFKGIEHKRILDQSWRQRQDLEAIELDGFEARSSTTEHEFISVDSQNHSIMQSLSVSR
jgi:hypothetical protein